MSRSPRIVLTSCGVLIISLLALPARSEPDGPVRERVSFNTGWRFLKSDDAPWTAAQLDYAVLKPWLLAFSANAVEAPTARPARPEGNFSPAGIGQIQPDFDDSGWRALDLPHDWGVEGPFRQEYPGETGKLAWWGTAWYRKRFEIPAADAGRRVALEIDGAMAYSTVWLNGQLVGGWPYGYTSYAVDLTPHLVFGGSNVVVIRLDNPPDSSRWYPGGGLYRNVWLTKTAAVHVTRDSLFVTTPRVSAQEAWVNVDALVENETDRDREVTVTTRYAELDARGIRTEERPAGAAVVRRLPARQQISVSQGFAIAQPHLWGVSHPDRYVLVTTVSEGDKVLDTCATPFGVRSAVFDADRGFLLNGERVPLRGVCLHHDLGALGTAVHVRALERQLELLRAMGCNAIRTSHNPPAPELLELCDRLGFLVMDEAFDCWTQGKKRNDYHQLFADWHERDLRTLIRRDRNHPSVVLWSIGNEVRDQHEAAGWKIGARLAAIVREEDRSRPVTAGLDAVPSGYNGLQRGLDVVGYNYKPLAYADFHRTFPAIPVLGSETASTISSRGEYFFPLSDDKADPGSRVNFQVSSYDLSAETWANQPTLEWAALEAEPYVAGEFVWTGFDYLGESSPYLTDATAMLNFSDPAVRAARQRELEQTGEIQVPSRSSYFGILDLAGFPKDRYYFYQAHWRPELPLAHLLPHWTWPARAGLVTPVHVYTTGDEAELFLNGRSLGRKARPAGSPRIRWDDVRYEPGELKVVAYRSGRPWAEETVRTAGAAARLQAEADHARLRADGTDLAFIAIAVQDSAGTLVPTADTPVRFSLQGPGRLIGLVNGDPTNHESFQGTAMRAFNGRVLAIVRTQRGAVGDLVLRAEADGLPPVQVKLRAE